jgi:hypothetical protein
MKHVSAKILAKSFGLGPRQIRVRASTGTVDRVGDILVPSGCIVRGSKTKVLAAHDARLESIIGDAVVSVSSDAVDATIEFLPEGLNPKADLACALYKGGFGSDISVGFDPIEAHPISGGGVKFSAWELLEISCVINGCNPDATVLSKATNSQRTYIKSLQDRVSAASRSTPASRADDIARLKAVGEQYERDAIMNAPTAAHFCTAMRETMEREARQRSSAMYERDPEVQRADRLREIECLRLK